MATPTEPDRPLLVARLEKFLDNLAHRPFWPRKQKAYSPQGLLYAAINRRMLAAIGDAFVLSILLLPFNDPVTRYAYGNMRFNSLQLSHALSGAGTSVEAMRAAFDVLKSSGMLHAFMVLTLVQFTVLAVYSFTCWHFWGATPGKLLLSMRIVDAKTGAAPTNMQWGLRLLGYVVSAIPLMLGFFAINWSRQSRGWHDHIAGTAVVVVKTRLLRRVADPSNSPAPSAAE